MKWENIIFKLIWWVGLIAVLLGIIGCPIALYVGNTTLGLSMIIACGVLIFIYTMLVVISARWWTNKE